MAYKIILKGKYLNYVNALKVLKQKTLEERRESISLKFAKKNRSHPKLKHLFELKENLRTRSGNIFQETRYNTRRGQNGPVNYLVRLLNNMKTKTN